MKRFICIFLLLILALSFVSCSSETDEHGEVSYEYARNFLVLDQDGNTVTLSQFIGKPIVINFWASWCPPCKAELPDFEKAYKEYGDVVFLMVNLTDGSRETVDSAKDFISQNGYTFPVYFDTEFSASYAYSLSSIPVTCFIDEEGNLVTSRVGMIDYDTLVDGIKKITE